MMLRFRYENVNDEYEYQEDQLQGIDSCLDEDQIRHKDTKHCDCEEPWSHLDWEDKVHIYDCIQPNCLYRPQCPRQFEIPMDQHPALLGVFPAHTRYYHNIEKGDRHKCVTVSLAITDQESIPSIFSGIARVIMQ